MQLSFHGNDVFERTLISFLATSMAIALLAGGLLWQERPKVAAKKPPPWIQATADNPTGSYRFTAKGWEDSVHWRIDGEEGKVNFMDNIHPLILTLIILLTAIGLAILVSDEEHVQSLLSKK